MKQYVLMHANPSWWKGDYMIDRPESVEGEVGRDVIVRSRG